MSCPAVKCLCEHLVISQSVTFANDQLIITIPAGNYQDREKYCIVVGQAIPTTTTINAPVVIRIGTGTTDYPVVNCDCTNTTACQINSRTRYSMRVHTNIQSGVFKLLGRGNCYSCCKETTSLPITTTTEPVVGGEG